MSVSKARSYMDTVYFGNKVLRWISACCGEKEDQGSNASPGKESRHNLLLTQDLILLELGNLEKHVLLVEIIGGGMLRSFPCLGNK